METASCLRVLTNGEDANQRKHFARSVEVLTRWFAKWTDAFPSHAVTRLQVATYVESLDDLSPEELDRGCREATRIAEQFPKPGHIRHALKQLEDIPRMRPAYLDEPTLSVSERWGPEEQAASDALRKNIGLPLSREVSG